MLLGSGPHQAWKSGASHRQAAGCDGAMLGRAIYGNPWLFANRAVSPTPEERIEALIRLFANAATARADFVWRVRNH